MTDTVAPPPALFINEDISKPENRTNLALLGVLTIPEFRYWFLGRLALPPDSLIYPPQNTSGVRPDFVVTDPEGTVRAWVEVELAGENVAQLESFRTKLQEPVKSITGSLDSATDLSLEELATVLRDALGDVLDRQQRWNAQLFIDLVTGLKSKAQTGGYALPGPDIQQAPFVLALRGELAAELDFGVPPVKAGRLMITTSTQKGWTLRCHAKEPTYGSVSILWSTALGSGVLRVPSHAQLAKYLAIEAVDSYAAFLREHFGFDINAKAGGQSEKLHESDLLVHLGDFARRVRLLANAG